MTVARRCPACYGLALLINFSLQTLRSGSARLRIAMSRLLAVVAALSLFASAAAQTTTACPNGSQVIASPYCSTTRGDVLACYDPQAGTVSCTYGEYSAGAC